MKKRTLTIPEFEHEMIEIENIQDQVGRYLHANWLYKMWNFSKAQRLYDLAERKMAELFNCELVTD